MQGEPVLWEVPGAGVLGCLGGMCMPQLPGMMGLFVG